jgi:hypothetical protein
MISTPKSVREGDPGSARSVLFRVSLFAAQQQSVVITYSTADGTATAGSDYVAKRGTLIFAPGETTKTIRVNFIADTMAEANETFFLDIRTAGETPIVKSRGAAYIRNDDGPQIFIDDAAPVFEGPAPQAYSFTTPQEFLVRLSAASANTITVEWTTANGTAGPADYVVANGRLTFTPGETQKTITVLVKTDERVEPTETYRVKLTRPTYATIGDSHGIAYIRNDDSAPGVVGEAPSR